ncbi:hypothetical protein D1970_10220 [Mesobacillus zeae]|uniref:YbyB n=1 Tax=Mesobacillus zeae TaxID=1917180 RepID=A0A398B6H1_9BACI|nr:hypothetical protein [Mesobacillus zeae]RID85151.1 hypothetical protein D1970_10220 [Mesobacillus zeae]
MQTNSLKPYVLLGVGAAAIWMAMKPKENINKIKQLTTNAKEKVMSMKSGKTTVLPVQKAGNPDPLDVEDNKMVSEGSMYGVNYYNENIQQK